MGLLEGKIIAVLVADGFEESELVEPIKAINEAGGKAEIVSLKPGHIMAWSDDKWSDTYPVDKTLDSVTAEDYDGLLLPGGVLNPDILRRNKMAVSFVKAFFEGHKQKPIAAICHGPWMLIEADLVKDRTLTSFESLKTDLINAGANWVDEEVVVDNGLVTSRSPEDLEAFTKKMVEEFYEGKHPIAV